MKKACFAYVAAILAVTSLNVVSAGEIDDELQNQIGVAGKHDLLRALVYLSDRVDLPAMTAQLDAESATLATRHERVVRALQEKAAATQGPLLAYLGSLMNSNSRDWQIGEIDPFWIVNGIFVKATPAVLRELASRPDVDILFADYRIQLIEPVSIGQTDEGNGGMRSDPEQGLIAIRATECWDIGIDGTGVLTSNLDTGVDGNHKALKDRWRGVSDDRYEGHQDWAFYNPAHPNDRFPFDNNGHGTHTMGTIVGGAPGDSVGVAPKAEWIAAGWDYQNPDQFTKDVIKAFQWLADPDGDPSTNWDVPTANSNSWRLNEGFGTPPCDEDFWEALDGCEAAGIIILFSAGNEGSGPETIGVPPDRATTDYMCFSVGAVDGNQNGWPIASFSSRGPSHCTPDGSETFKPEISAPGVDVRSSLPGNGYGFLSGTSMASPHVNGVCTLMRQANPDISVDEAKQVLFDTAIDLGKEGEDNDYGHGMIDAYEAVLKAIDLSGVKFSYPEGRPFSIDPDGGSIVRFDVAAGPKDNPIPGTGKLLVDSGSGFVEAKVRVLADNSYEGVFPVVPCDVIVKYYVTVEGESGKTYVHPTGAPKNYWTTRVFNEIGIAYIDNFETNRGFLTAKDNKTNDGFWERGVPVADKNWPHAPSHDSDGSGSCWLTGNEVGNSDIDGGAVYLTSGALDVSLLVNLRYSYYFTEVNDSDNSDYLAVQISATAAKDSWKQIARHETSTGGEWKTDTFTRAELETALGKLGSTAYLRFIAADKGGGNIVEAAIDDLQIDGPTCNPHGPKVLRGDLDCDGGVNFNDVDPFVLALTGRDGYESQFPDCNFDNGDINQDGEVNFSDIDPFVDCLANGGCE